MLVTHLVLENLPPTYGQATIKDFVEGTLDRDVIDVTIHHALPGKAVIELDGDIDLKAAQESLMESPIEKQNVAVLRTQKRPCTVIVNNVEPAYLSEEFLEIYFCAEFGDGENIVSSCSMSENLKMAAVDFYENVSVMSRILAKRDHVPLPSEDYHILVEPFFMQFHDCLEQHLLGGEQTLKISKDQELHVINGNNIKGKFENNILLRSCDKEQLGELKKITGEIDTKEKNNGTGIGDKMEEEEGGEKIEIGIDQQMELDTVEVNTFSREEVCRGSEAMRNQGRGSKTRSGRGCRGSSVRGRAKVGNKSLTHRIHHNKEGKGDTATATVDLREKVESEIKFSDCYQISEVSLGNSHKESVNSYGNSLDLADHNEKHIHPPPSSIFPRVRGSRGISVRDRTRPVSRNKECGGDKDFLAPALDLRNEAADEKQFSDHKQNARVSSEDSNKQNTNSSGYSLDSQNEEKVMKFARFESEGLTQSVFKTFKEKESVTMIQSKLLATCFGDFENCTVRYDAAQEIALFEGSEECVRERYLMFLTEMMKIKETLLEPTDAMRQILKTSWKQPCIEKLCDLTSVTGCKLFYENDSFKVLAHGEENLKLSVEKVKTEINGTKKIPIKGNISELDYNYLKSSAEVKFPVIVSIQEPNTHILVQGMKGEVGKATESIEENLSNFLNGTDTFEIVGSQAGYVNTMLLDKILPTLKDVTVADQERSDTKVSITVCGRKPQVNDAMKHLRAMMSKVHSKSWDLRSEFKKEEDLMLVAASYSTSNHLKFSIDDFRKEHHCFVSFKAPKVTEATPSYSQQSRQANRRTKTSSIPKQPSTNKAEHHIRCRVNQERPLVFNLNNTCQLFLQANANITQENSAGLVCVLDDRADLRKTRVGSAFNKACPTLYKKLEEVKKANPPGTVVLVTNAPFKGLPQSCQTVYHVILSKWSPGSSEANLTQAVKTIVTHTLNAGLTSISIPPLGCGRVLGYPSSSVAQIMIQTLRSFIPAQGSLKRVILLAGDPALIGDYKKEAQNVLSSVSSSSVNITGDAIGGNLEELGAFGGDDGLSKPNEGSFEDFDISDESDAEEETKIQFQHESPGSVTIWGEHKEKLETLWSKLKDIVIKLCLHVEYFDQSEFEAWPKHFHKKIVLLAKEKSVWIESSKNPKTKKANYSLKGEEHSVDKVMERIKVEHSYLVEKISRRISSSKAPKRGTVDFVQYAASCNEMLPSYWNLSQKDRDRPGFLERNWKKLKESLSSSGKTTFLTNVDPETKQTIIKLVTQDLFDPARVGHGNDASSLNHKGLKVVDVKRVENLALFEPYNMNRKRLFEDCSRRKKICPDIKSLPGSKGRVFTTECLPSFMKKELYWEVNEHYLFHGSSNIDTLINSGPDPRVGSEGGMFGKGFYLAEMTTKSDQYSDKKNNRKPPDSTLTLIMFRALLGNPFLCDHTHPSVQSRDSKKLIRPPCVKCKHDFCSCSPQILFDSVIGDGKWLFREFVLYDRDRCYPEYVIYYKRV